MSGMEKNENIPDDLSIKGFRQADDSSYDSDFQLSCNRSKISILTVYDLHFDYDSIASGNQNLVI